MNEANEKPSESFAPLPTSYRGGRIILALLALLSCAVPLTHYRFIHTHLDGLRYPWGLLPAEFLFFRWLGELSIWFPVGFLAAFAGSFIRPALTRRSLITGIVTFLCFSVLYLCYSLLIAFILLERIASPE